MLIYSNGLISFIRNKVIGLNTENASINAGGNADFDSGADIMTTAAGHPVQSFYGWISDGIFQSAADVTKSPAQYPNTWAGDIKFKT